MVRPYPPSEYWDEDELMAENQRIENDYTHVCVSCGHKKVWVGDPDSGCERCGGNLRARDKLDDMALVDVVRDLAARIEELESLHLYLSPFHYHEP